MINTDRMLIEKSQAGDKKALEKLIKENSGLVWSIIKRFEGRGYEKEDLFQIGTIGLIKSIRRFDLKLEFKLSTFAVPYILGEIKRFIRDDGIIKVSRSIKELAIKIKEIENNYLNKYGKNISINELSKSLNTSEEEIYLAMDSIKQVESINDEVFEDGNREKIETIVGEENTQEKLINKLALKQLIEKLSKREKEIINLRYFKDKTQTQVARILGISQVQVSRIEKRIILNMRSELVLE